MNKQEHDALEKVKPLCVNCKHYNDHDGWSDPSCKIAVLGAEPVNGIITYNKCGKERQVAPSAHLRERQCGPEGKHFEALPEPKLSWFERIIKWFDNYNEEEFL